MSRAAAEVGSTANSYQILGRLATGGMAEIFLAKGEGVAGVERHCVLKRILPDLATDVHFVQMFLDEVRLAAQLQHPNIAQVYDTGKLGDSYFFTMEYVHGETVRALLHHAQMLRRPLPIPCVLTIIAGAAAGLHHAHVRVGVDGRALGIVHRDVSPSNLMVSYEGGVKLVDFGVAKAADRSQETKSGTVKGKIGYLSPEQARGWRVDRRSDLFSLGICFWEMLTTERLYRRATDFENMSAIVSEPSAPPSSRRPDVPREVDELVLRLLAKEPEHRFQTAEAVVEAVEALAVRTGAALSTSGLGRFMRELFGHRPEPWLELETLNDPIGPFTVTSEPVPGELASAPAERRPASPSEPSSATMSLDDDQLVSGVATRSERAPRGAPIARPPLPGAARSAAEPVRVTRPLTVPPLPGLPAERAIAPSPAVSRPAQPPAPAALAVHPAAVPPAVDTFTGSSGRVAVRPPATPLTLATPPIGVELDARSPVPGLDLLNTIPMAPDELAFDTLTGADTAISAPRAAMVAGATGQRGVAPRYAPPGTDALSPSASQGIGQVMMPVAAAASGPTVAVPPGAPVPFSHAPRPSGTLLGMVGPLPGQPMPPARAQQPRPAVTAPVTRPALPGLAPPRGSTAARFSWSLYAVIGGAALVGSIAMILVMRREADSAAPAPASPLGRRGDAQVGAPPPERRDAMAPAGAGEPSAAKVVPSPRAPSAAKLASAVLGAGSSRAAGGAAKPATAVSPATAPPRAATSQPPATGSPVATPRAPARSDVTDPASHDVARLYGAGQFDQVVAQCGVGPVPAELAATCVLAACRLRNEAAARRLLLAVPAARRDALASSCKQVGLDLRGVDCEADPMACPH